MASTPPTRLISPLGMRILVRVLAPDSKTKAGLYLPANVTDDGKDALYGEVIEVARADEGGTLSGGANISGVPDGAHVLFAPDAGLRVPWDDQLRLVETKDVVAVVTELQPQDVQ